MLCAPVVAGQARATQSSSSLLHNQSATIARLEPDIFSGSRRGAASSTSSTAEPASLFDAFGAPDHPVRIMVEVHDVVDGLNTTQAVPSQAGGQEIISSAGTYGDIARLLQTSPGVVGGSDLSNEFFVRGGHPMENLFQMPNINSLATLGTTGGFGPMIETGVVQRVSPATGGYNAHHPERLSSVTELTTL